MAYLFHQRLVVAWLLLLTCGLAQAQEAAPIRIWGHGHRGQQDYIQTLLTAWQEGFRKTHPEARFADSLYGDASGIGALFTGVADLAILDREASFIEVDAYQQGAGHDPFAVPVARGAVATPHHAPAVQVYVGRGNPLAQLTLVQLDGIFDADHRRSAQSYTTWGELGLTGAWAARPIHMYGPAIETAEMQFFELAAMKGSQKFSCCLTLLHPRAGTSVPQQMAVALAKDPGGIALSTVPLPGLKAVALAAGDGPAVQATAQSLRDGSYPLARTVYIYANRKPHAPLPETVAAFLAYIVSPEGQAVVARTGGYLPLPPDVAAHARELLQ